MAVIDLSPSEFLKSPAGAIRFGMIAADCPLPSGCRAREIRLQVGDLAWGAVHISHRRDERLAELGYSFIEDFVADVAENYTSIYLDDGRLVLYMPACRSCVKGVLSRYDYVIVLQYGGADFWSISTGYEVRRNKKMRGKLFWQRSEPAISIPS